MMPVNEVFYTNEERPVRVLGSSYGHGPSRSSYGYGEDAYSHSPRLMHQYSRGRGGAYHNGYRYSRNSVSPPRERESLTGLNIRDRLFGRKNDSPSPPRSRHSWYRDHRDSFGRNAYSPPGRYHGSRHTSYSTVDSEMYATGYASSDIYHGQHTSTVPRTYQSANYYDRYGSNPYDLNTIKLKVPICCEACEERITNHLLELEGVHSVTCDQIKEKVIVTGTADPSSILRAAKDCFKNSRYWRD